ncbi:carbohydrate-binding family 9-like protein [Chryseolinea sp. T2]|uniref:carbohydrate-binding family 9-like protein n=1 Tax=Chryseolinea sp. T2 TaxID=3129255 RepID=UPI0030785C0B
MPSTTYLVRRTPGDFDISGDGSSPGWQQSTWLTDFSYPWEDDNPSRTSFKALHGDLWIYFLFDVDDTNVHVDIKTNDKLEVIDSSRVEIFFRINEQLNPYYCLELDAAGRILDYQGHFHRKFDFTWNWPAGELVVKATKREGGYMVETAVSKSSLRTLGLLSPDEQFLQAGLYRAQCTRAVAAREHMRWISWIKPESKTPDFHIPSSFGSLQLLD